MTEFVRELGEVLREAAAPREQEAPADRVRTAADPPGRPPLGPHPVLRYAVAPEAERYRRIMRVIYAEHRNFGLRLSPEAVAGRLRDAFALELDPPSLQASLDQLYEWGALDREYDTSLARTARELRRNRFTYDLRPAGKRTEQLLQELDQLSDSYGALEGGRLAAIRDALAQLARVHAEPGHAGGDLRQQFERLIGEVERLHEGASNFMSRLNRIVATSEQVDENEFDRCKGALIEHLQGFRRDLRRHADDIAAGLRTIERLGPERMIARIVLDVELPVVLGVTPEEIAAQRHAELLDQWHGVWSWFIDERERSSPWAALTVKVIDAIRAILDIAERIIDRRTLRADRARACQHLARLVHDAPEDEAVGIVVAAFGIAAPRHVGVPEDDPEALASPAQTSWLAAPPAPVTAHLRRPGGRMPGAGRGAPIVDTAAVAARLRERARREREELAALLERFAGRGPIRLSDIARFGTVEFGHLLHWIGRAYETPAHDDGTRRASSRDGRAAVLLRPPAADEPPVVLAVPQGRFTTANYRLEVRTA
jgi:uncharacterized protein (TIGR02677 family)